MRYLPKNKTEKQKLIIAVVKDYFGDPTLEEEKSIRKIALWIMGRRRRLKKLTSEEREALWGIRRNLADEVYTSSFQ